jgi:hypothetical protein
LGSKRGVQIGTKGEGCQEKKGKGEAQAVSESRGRVEGVEKSDTHGNAVVERVSKTAPKRRRFLPPFTGTPIHVVRS